MFSRNYALLPGNRPVGHTRTLFPADVIAENAEALLSAPPTRWAPPT